MTAERDRTRRHTAASVLAQIDKETHDRLLLHAEAGSASVSQRLRRLDREWDVDRALETESALVALAGIALGATADRRFFALPGFVASMVLVQALSGWYPLLPLFRRLGIRTAREINRERYALKALRGDLDHLDEPAPQSGFASAESDGRRDLAEARMNA